MDTETLYFQLRQLAETAPSLMDAKAVTADDRRWLGRVAALVELVLSRSDYVKFKTAADGIGSITHDMNAPTVLNIFHRALAKAELAAPAAAQGRFVAAGDTFSALTQVSKVFARAKADLLIVDKWADNTLVTDFVVTAPIGVAVRVLCAEGENRRAALAPALERWAQQFGESRPLDVRMVAGPHLHDRMIFIDGQECWVAGQSFNNMAAKSPTYLSMLDADLAEQKLAAYTAIWESASQSAVTTPK